MSEHYIEMELREIQIAESLTHSQVIVLGEKDGDRAFPIFIGMAEAIALDQAVHGQQAARPLTHDLIMNVLNALGARIERVLVVKLVKDIFYGAIEVSAPNVGVVRIDSRPSDAIVLASKTAAPILVEKQVLEEVFSSTLFFQVDAEDPSDTDFMGSDDGTPEPDEEP